MKKYTSILVMTLLISSLFSGVAFAENDKKNDDKDNNGSNVTRDIKDEAKGIQKRCKAFVKMLQRGHRDRLDQDDDDVTALQQVLWDRGHLSVSPTGNFGPLTEEALKKFQSANGLAPVGFAGPLTRALLFKFRCAGVGQIVKDLKDDDVEKKNKPDLKITEVSCTPSPLGLGIPANCAVSVLNSSNIAATGTFLVIGGNATSSVDSLGARQTKVVTLNNVFSSAVSGNFKITFTADSTNTINEWNENNNTFVKALVVGNGGVCPNLTTVMKGDANCDGKIDGTDYDAINQGFRNQKPIDWAHGDFNLDGRIDFDDFALIDLSYNTQFARSLTVTTPNGNETWTIGTLHTVTWTSKNFPAGSKVSISLQPFLGGAVTVVKTDTDNDGTEQITVPNMTGTFRIQVGSSLATDTGDGVITLTQLAQPQN